MSNERVNNVWVTAKGFKDILATQSFRVIFLARSGHLARLVEVNGHFSGQKARSGWKWSELFQPDIWPEMAMSADGRPFPTGHELLG